MSSRTATWLDEYAERPDVADSVLARLGRELEGSVLRLAAAGRRRDRNLLPRVRALQDALRSLGDDAFRGAVRDYRAELENELTETDLAELDRAFPPRSRKRSLEMI